MRAGTLSLKSVLAVYFIPISVLPAIFISFYATRLFQDSNKETLESRARSERDAIVAEFEGFEAELLQLARSHAGNPRLLTALALPAAQSKSRLPEALASFRQDLLVRVYASDGSFLAGRNAERGERQIPYLSREGLLRVKARGETADQYFTDDANGFVTVVRLLLKQKTRVIGILEEEYRFGPKALAELGVRRQVDVVVFNRDFTASGASFALAKDVMRSISQLSFQNHLRGVQDPIFIQLGDTRYATFLYDLPSFYGKNKHWGYLALFLSMTSVDQTAGKLKLALVYLTALLILVSTLLIFVFSKRLVRPIEILVLAMKRVKAGRVEQIPTLDSTYEIEYLVRSFNEMARNVSQAKQTLELKLEELRRANLEIKTTQSHLVQSAKMISLGQIVAGVAHELNNPIAFIYSNMHHLSEYIEKVKEMIAAFRARYDHLPEADRLRLQSLERELEIDFILKDMEELTRSCVEGANRTKDIVMGLRTFSRMDESVFRAVDIHEGLRSTLKLLVAEFKDRITIHEEFGIVGLVECNLSQLNQVFMNLLSNAAHAISGKGDIWIRTQEKNQNVVIEIEDSGSGMSAEVVDKIFDPFFTTKTVGQGTGLGLSIAYGLVQKHRGNIQVSSQVGQGTRFTILLPLRQPLAEVG